MRQVFKVVREPSIPVPDGESFTPGVIYLDNVRFGFSCEDQDRKLESGGQKVYGKTAIPRGEYKVITSFSNRFQKVLPEVLNVPQFKGIRFHGGNKAEDSEGCILIGKVRTQTGIAQCADTVKRMIDAIESAEELGIESWLKVE